MEGGGGLEPIKLSVLVCGIAERIPDGDETDGHVLYELDEQVRDKPVELLYLLDNRKMTVGRKRNILLAIAQGEWVAFCDDDDEVAGDYIDRLLSAIEQVEDAGVIVFPQLCIHHDTGEREHCTYGLALPYAKDGDRWTGKPAHTQCWKTELIQSCEFPEKDFQEDVDWVAQACQRVTKEYAMKPDMPYLYTYHYDPAKSRTRGL